MNKNMMNTISKVDELSFQNVSENNLTLEDVLGRIIRFITKDPKGTYHFVIGTDSQVHRGHTKFVTGIVIHRVGRGAWACYRQLAVPRELSSIREKLALETSFSQRVAGFFDSYVVMQMEKVLLPFVYQGATLETFIDIDAGTELEINKTALYVQEMVDRVDAMGLYAPRVKPEAYAASAYANRYTKSRMVLEVGRSPK
jgi:predicted RNase H-related nuclease YkuK (DUF458 family)